MTAATFRYPGPLAISVAQVDQMSGGRVEFGIGAGWYEAEHTAYGIPFPSLGERFERYEEQLAIITGLWETPLGGTFSFEGKHYTLTDSPGAAQARPGTRPGPDRRHGRRRTPALAASYATEFNLPFVGIDDAVQQYARVDAACEEMGRDPKEIIRSVALVACVGRTDADVARRAAAIGREVDELKQNGLCGTPAEVVDTHRQVARADRHPAPLPADPGPGRPRPHHRDRRGRRTPTA